MKPIPISAGKSIAEEYGYDQVIIIARKTGFLKVKVMGWHKE